MPLTRLARTAALAALCPLAIAGTGCEFLDQFEDGGGLVNFYSAHHGTARDGQFPERPTTDRIELDTDTGWHVIIAEAYVTTSAITLERCDGDSLEADFYWGPLCEDLLDPDLQAYGVGAVQADAGNYCSATITYGPFVDGATPGEHSTEGGEAGDTVYLRGLAEKGDQSVPFEIKTAATLSVQVDLSTVQDGGPLSLGHDEYFATELTFSKTYDRFFDGVDFDELASMDFEPIVLDTLELETGVVYGTEITP